MKPNKILFTSVGRRVELIKCFRKAAEKLNSDLIIYGADISDSAPALFFCDRQVLVPRIDNPNYIPELLRVCGREKINLLIPTIDTDLLLLSKHKKDFKKIGTEVLIASEDKVALSRDKRFTADYFISCGLNSPKPVDDYAQYEQGFPAFIKPRDGSSSINAYKINDAEELKSYASVIDGYIVQPFIDGVEYTIDAFCDFDGNPIFITPRERVAVRSGEVLKTRMEQDDEMIEECKKLLADYKPSGAITVQLIKQKETGKNFYIEINPRFGGGAPLSMMAGADSAEACIRLLNGEKMEYQPKAAKNNSIYSRFDQSICVSERDEITQIARLYDVRKFLDGVSAVVFDLDDTLFDEKEYVRSGFKAVAEQLPDIIDIEEKLWEAFEKGEPAIDSVLKNAGVFSEELKNACLNVYRNHKPDLKLSTESYNLLRELKSQNFKIAIVTDGRPQGQRNKIEALNLKDLVDDIVITDELGGVEFRKPCDIGFRIIQKKFNMPYSKIVYVGDNPKKDFIAPQQLGMKCIYYANAEGLYSI